MGTMKGSPILGSNNRGDGPTAITKKSPQPGPEPISALIDVDQYPIHLTDSNVYRGLTSSARKELAGDGCCVLPAFIRPEAVRFMSKEVLAMRPRLHESLIAINPYFSEGDSSLEPDHPVNTFTERSGGFIPRDAFDRLSNINAVYRWPPLSNFLADCLGLPKIFCYADPLAGLTINVLDPGQQFAWHFDTNEFAVTILLDEPSGGGLFQYSPGIRNQDDENFDGVKACLAGDLNSVTTLELHPGDLQLFRGRHSLHRVTKVSKLSGSRNTAVLAYTEEERVIGTVERTRQLFGRVLPEHTAAETERNRSDFLRD